MSVRLQVFDVAETVVDEFAMRERIQKEC